MKSPRASVLILALWALFFLGALALAAAAYVSASIEMTRFLKNESRAYYLARAGVDYAVAVVGTNYLSYSNNPALFENQHLGNDLETFSVKYAFVSKLADHDGRAGDGNANLWVTNWSFGVGSCSSTAYGGGKPVRINIDARLNQTNTTLQQLEAAGISDATRRRILEYNAKPSRSTTKRKVESDVESPYDRFLSVQELSAVKGLTWSEYIILEPLVTIDRFMWDKNKKEERGNPRYSFGGVSEGRIEVERENGSRTNVATSRIVFVFSVTNGAERVNFLHWREY